MGGSIKDTHADLKAALASQAGGEAVREDAVRRLRQLQSGGDVRGARESEPPPKIEGASAPLAAPPPERIAYKGNLVQTQVASWYALGQSTGELADQIALQGLKTLSLAHGGALVGMLTFIGHYPELVGSRSGVVTAFVMFSLGLTDTLLAMLLAYSAQLSFHRRCWTVAERLYESYAFDDPKSPHDTEELKHLNRGAMFEVGAVTAVLLSFIFFILGCGFGVFALIG
jgi:hypothetical protein